MDIKLPRKETSERSEGQNWVLDELSTSSQLYFSSFEGCNVNASNQVTTVLDRALIEIEGSLEELPHIDQVRDIIEQSEGRSLSGKLTFCKNLGIPYTYIFYNYKYRNVLRYELTDDKVEFVKMYPSFEAFSGWIQSIKQWTSSKDFGEYKDLPEFDRALRRAGCAWPTNIDSVAYTCSNKPLALIEFQNAKLTTVRKHTNNAYFLPRFVQKDQSYDKGPDERRWCSLEVLRLQTELPLLTIVWSQCEDIVVVKQLQQVTFPDYPDGDLLQQYLIDFANFYENTHSLSRIKENPLYSKIIEKNASSHLVKKDGIIVANKNFPPLDYDRKTLPFLYGDRIRTLNKGEVLPFLEVWLSSL